MKPSRDLPAGYWMRKHARDQKCELCAWFVSHPYAMIMIFDYDPDDPMLGLTIGNS